MNEITTITRAGLKALVVSNREAFAEIEALKQTVLELTEIIRTLEYRDAGNCDHTNYNGDEFVGGHCPLCKTVLGMNIEE